jgi:hypothetical protein
MSCIGIGSKRHLFTGAPINPKAPRHRWEWPARQVEIELENVLIGMVLPSIRPGQILTEHVNLKFSKVKWRYTRQKISGGTGGSTVGGWDLSTNKVV